MADINAVSLITLYAAREPLVPGGCKGCAAVGGALCQMLPPCVPDGREDKRHVIWVVVRTSR